MMISISCPEKPLNNRSLSSQIHCRLNRFNYLTKCREQWATFPYIL